MKPLPVTKVYLKHAGLENLKARLERLHRLKADVNDAAVKIQHEIMRRKKAGSNL